MAQEHESLHTLDSAHRIHHGMHNHLVPALLSSSRARASRFSKKNAVRSTPSSILTFQAPLPPSAFPLGLVALTPHYHCQASRLPPSALPPRPSLFPPEKRSGSSRGRSRRLSLNFVTRFKGTHALFSFPNGLRLLLYLSPIPILPSI